ncbi:hypothetical protein A6V39_05470 [Candidatus Mycoplasma haematobovis]|uniref:Uncharacterized protein n=1 Tax=Candidatus Mycoplasma haematobovis TaxID=432608 RepID=A0A1A9QBA7_9MOLU|nr:hypothetical protein [Candidatus Mycoplasma haematobovis]OAL09743.1 hypothetical protein A6V39_05470 [Candidatus Mycoplasma haematobovis]
MKILTKCLISAGALTSAIGGLTSYLLLNKGTEIKYNDFWDGKLENLEKELINLYRKKANSEKELATKMFGSGSVLFELNDNKDGFHDEMETQQRDLLSQFCEKPNKEEIIGTNLVNKFC